LIEIELSSNRNYYALPVIFGLPVQLAASALIHLVIAAGKTFIRCSTRKVHYHEPVARIMYSIL